MSDETATPSLVLASASARRRELLGALGLPFDVRPVDTDEYVPRGMEPSQAARRIAIEKLTAALAAGSENQSTEPVLVADTIVALDGRVLGKPVDAAHARAMLTDLRGRDHDVFTALGLGVPGQAVTIVVRTAVVMRVYTDAEIEATIAAGLPFDKAGSYAIQDEAFHPVERFDGCYCNVMGLPLWSVFHLLRFAASELTQAEPAATYARCAACPLRDAPFAPPLP